VEGPTSAELQAFAVVDLDGASNAGQTTWGASARVSTVESSHDPQTNGTVDRKRIIRIYIHRYIIGQAPDIVPPDHLLLDSAPNLGPLIWRWEIYKFENC
jgi:hypothetical protein